MARNKGPVINVDGCPLLSITQAALFILVTTFVLYLPLGDPNKIQWENDYVPLCCISDVYAFVVKLAFISSNILQYAWSAIREGLYEMKLLFYIFLETVDRQDLCRSVCCFVESEEYVNVDNQQHGGDGDKSVPPRSPCRCVKKKCRKHRP